MDVVLLAGLAGFFVTAAWRTPAFLFLVTSVVALLVADEVYASGTYNSGDWTDIGWLPATSSGPRRRCIRRWRALASAPAPVGRARALGSHRAAHRGAPERAVRSARAVPPRRRRRPAGNRDCGHGDLRPRRPAPASESCARSSGLRERERSARADAEQAQMLLALQNDQLVEADKLKDEFVALISHDLRTPLTSIIGYVELSLEESRAAARRGAPRLLADRVAKLGAAAAARRRPALRRAASGGAAHPRAVRPRSLHHRARRRPRRHARARKARARARVHRRLTGDDRR